MITIKQEAELPFHHVDVKDAVIMANLMNDLACRIAEQKAAKKRHDMPDDTRNLYQSIYVDSVRIPASDAEKIFNILSVIGFVATEEYSAEDILAEHLKKD